MQLHTYFDYTHTHTHVYNLNIIQGVESINNIIILY